MKSRKAGAGFTLLELVIAITILSLITLVIGSGFRIGIRAWERGEEETGRLQKLRVLSSMFSQQLTSAYPYKMKLKDTEKPVVIFRGEPDSMIFVTSIADFSFGGFKWVKFMFKDGNLLYREGLLPDKKLEEKIKGEEEVVDSDIDRIEFEYLSKSGDWEESWDYGEELPVAVTVRISDFQPFVINIPMGTKDKEEDRENRVVEQIL